MMTVSNWKADFGDNLTHNLPTTIAPLFLHYSNLSEAPPEINSTVLPSTFPPLDDLGDNQTDTDYYTYYGPNVTQMITTLTTLLSANLPGGDVSTGLVAVNSSKGHNYTEASELYQVPVSIIILLSLLYGGISVTALVGNVLVLWVVTVSRRMRTVTNMFIANLALADIIIGLFAIPFQFQAALLQRWNLPDFMCAFCPFVQVLSVNVSVFTLSAIALDRYRAVLFPLSARVSKRKATWVILSIWSVGLLLAVPMEVDYKFILTLVVTTWLGLARVTKVMEKGKLKPFCENLGLNPTLRLYYGLGLVVIQYFLPLFILTGAYVHMGVKLWGATAPGNKEESRDAVVLRNKKKVIKMLSVVVLLFGVCWLPLQMYNFLQTLIPSINSYQYINIIWFSFHWLAMSNSCYNPFIYAIYNEKFQREFRTRLWCIRIFVRNTEDQMYSEASDFDRSKIRASYRFSTTRSVRYNHQSVYGRKSSEFRRNSSLTSRRSSVVHLGRHERSGLRHTNSTRVSNHVSFNHGAGSRHVASSSTSIPFVEMNGTIHFSNETEQNTNGRNERVGSTQFEESNSPNVVGQRVSPAETPTQVTDNPCTNNNVKIAQTVVAVDATCM